MLRTLLLLRHGESQANADGLFTGLLDVPLTERGQAEIIEAAHLLDEAGLWPEIWFCSPLLRTKRSAEILASCLRHPPVDVVYDWRLAERNYGVLTGRSKSEVRAAYGPERFLSWRRSVDGAPPAMSRADRSSLGSVPEALGLTESLLDVITRVNDFCDERLDSAFRQARSVLIMAHGNSLRALCTILDQLNHGEVQELNIPTAHPLMYQLDLDGRPIVRGGTYLNPVAANIAAAHLSLEGGT